MRISFLSGPKKLAFSILAACVTAAGVAAAIPLGPGASGPPVGESLGSDPTLAGPIVVSQTLPFGCTAGGATISGTLDNYVVKNALGTLDFYYHVNADPTNTDRIIAVQSADFAVAAVDADYRTDLPGMIPPIKVSRSAGTGSVVEWDFMAISPGWDSSHFYSRSGRTGFNPVGKTIIRGGSVTCGVSGTYMPL